MNHNWATHQHEVSGWHGNIQCDLQHWRCRHCGKIQQMPAQGEIQPPHYGCTASHTPVARIPEAKNPIEEKGDYYEPVRNRNKAKRN